IQYNRIQQYNSKRPSPLRLLLPSQNHMTPSCPKPDARQNPSRNCAATRKSRLTTLQNPYPSNLNVKPSRPLFPISRDFQRDREFLNLEFKIPSIFSLIGPSLPL
ncbi:hypothetical protein AABB24_037200, partial [Solanum stoloniferum]